MDYYSLIYVKKMLDILTDVRQFLDLVDSDEDTDETIAIVEQGNFIN
jgi:hypothetical protein